MIVSAAASTTSPGLTRAIRVNGMAATTLG